MNKLDNKYFEIKSVDFNEENKELVVRGYASIFNVEDTPQYTWNPEVGDFVIATDIMVKGAFTKTLSERAGRIAVCKNHNIDEPVAKIIELKEDEIGLYFEARISDAEDDLKTKIREKIFSEMSFGFKTIKADFNKKEDGTYTREVKEVMLFEISVVTIARNGNAKITEIKSITDFNGILDSLLGKEDNQEKKYQLLQLKSLVGSEPIGSLEEKKPIMEVEEFRKTIRESLN